MSLVRTGWTRQQLLVAFNLYCQIPFGKLHARNPEIKKYAESIGRTPSALAMKLTNIASLDPVITSTGRQGLKAASAADRNMWKEMQNNWESFILESEKAVALAVRPEEQKEYFEPVNYEGENKKIQTTARVGQTFFRKTVLSAYNNKCCITGLSEPRLLVASHIIPWHKDDSNRLNPRNGLLLSALHDKAFDLGLIAVDEDMTILISTGYAEADRYFDTSIRFYGGKQIALPKKFQPDVRFLKYHREHIFVN